MYRTNSPTFASMNEVLAKHTEVRITNKSHHPLPAYATDHSAGMDLRANLDAPSSWRPASAP
jgi:dUTPase